MTIDLQYGGNDHLFPKFYTRGKASHKTTDDGSQHTDQPTKLIDEHEPTTAILRRSERARRPTKFYQLGLDYVNYMDAGEPTSYEEAIAAPDAEPWLQAMKSEMDSIHQNHTWELVELPLGRKSLPCKWVFRLGQTQI